MREPALVLITGGGTGGHVFPGLATAESLQRLGARVHWLGTHSGMESRLVPAAGIPISYLRVSGLRGKRRWQQLLAPLQLLASIAQALIVVRRLRPDCVLGTGGFVAGPGALAAWLLRAPVVVHEQNAIAGTTNRLLAHIARRILIGLPGAFPANPRVQCVGNPVRATIAAIAAPRSRVQARTGRMRVLVIGGSQGAKALNDVVPDAVAQMRPVDRPDVWHQTGARDLERCALCYRDADVDARTGAFIDDMVEAYSWADVVVCRAGALTVSEIAVAGVASILVPLPGAIDDHQSANARWLSAAGAAISVAQAEFTPLWLATRLQQLMADRDQLTDMAERARELARPDAASDVARICLEVAQ